MPELLSCEENLGSILAGNCRGSSSIGATAREEKIRRLYLTMDDAWRDANREICALLHGFRTLRKSVLSINCFPTSEMN